MSEDLIQLPERTELLEMLAMAKQDINSEIQKDPEMLSSSKLLVKVIGLIEEKVSKHKDFSKLSEGEKIDLAAHLSFVHALLEDFFLFDDELDEDFDSFEEEEEEE